MKLKLARYCSYQERSFKESEEKLVKLGATNLEATKVLEWLEKEGFLNDARYLETYIKSKIKVNKWGKIKVKYSLIQKGFHSELIDQYLRDFSEKEYNEIITNLIHQRASSIKESDQSLRKNKIYQYLLRKGFESDLILEILHKAIN